MAYVVHAVGIVNRPPLGNENAVNLTCEAKPGGSRLGAAYFMVQPMFLTLGAAYSHGAPNLFVTLGAA